MWTSTVSASSAARWNHSIAWIGSRVRASEARASCAIDSSEGFFDVLGEPECFTGALDAELDLIAVQCRVDAAVSEHIAQAVRVARRLDARAISASPCASPASASPWK